MQTPAKTWRFSGRRAAAIGEAADSHKGQHWRSCRPSMPNSSRLRAVFAQKPCLFTPRKRAIPCSERSPPWAGQIRLPWRSGGRGAGSGSSASRSCMGSVPACQGNHRRNEGGNMNRSRSRSCETVTKDGQPCQAGVQVGSEFCFFHDPAKAADREAAQRAGGSLGKAKVLPHGRGRAKSG
jgi:hypothetical protein